MHFEQTLAYSGGGGAGGAFPVTPGVAGGSCTGPAGVGVPIGAGIVPIGGGICVPIGGGCIGVLIGGGTCIGGDPLRVRNVCQDHSPFNLLTTSHGQAKHVN